MKINTNVILLIIVAIIILLLMTNKTTENFDITTSNNEAIQNLASLYRSENLKVTNLTVTGNLNGGNNHVPIGTIVSWYDPCGNFSNLPTNWKLCDGKNGTPDLRGRFILGSFNQNDTNITDSSNNIIRSVRKMHDVGGTEFVTLTIDEMPAHTHAYNDTTRFINDTDKTMGSSAWNNNTLKWNEGQTLATGGSKPHNNMPPFYVLAYIMKMS